MTARRIRRKRASKKQVRISRGGVEGLSPRDFLRVPEVSVGLAAGLLREAGGIGGFGCELFAGAGGIGGFGCGLFAGAGGICGFSCGPFAGAGGVCGASAEEGEQNRQRRSAADFY